MYYTAPDDRVLTPAEECAAYIYDQDIQRMDYSYHIESKQNPQDHILYKAAEVLGLVDSEGFLADYECWADERARRKK